MKKFSTFIKSARMKPFDFVIFAFLGLASFSPVFLFGQKAQAGTIATLKHDGQTVRTFQLSANTTYTYDNHGNICNIQVKNGQIRVTSANCPTNICVKTGWTNSPNKPIICLPHGNVITINGQAKQDGKVVDYNE